VRLANDRRFGHDVQDMSRGKKRGFFFPNAHLWEESAIHYGASEELAKRLCRVIASALASQKHDKVKILRTLCDFVVTCAWTTLACV
jgi:hypothetical protein